MLSTPVITRFAPSPTGQLHVGSARTALFSWLYARHHGGQFLLRIEDTDEQRSETQFSESIFKDLDWLGLNADQAPVYQSQRQDIYQQHFGKLKKKAATYHKDGAWYVNVAKGLNALKQLKVLDAQGYVVVNDLIHGAVKFPPDELEDFVIIRADGTPVHHLALVIDDAETGVTHVIRGDDHLSNVPRQNILHALLGLPIPQYAHLPLILGPDRTRLSKRHGATGLDEFRAQGILPEALINYLARLGWGFGDQEIFSLTELIEKFSIEKVNKTAAVFDYKKLQWINKQYMKRMETMSMAQHLQKLSGEDFSTHQTAIELLMAKCSQPEDLLSALKYFTSDAYPTETEARDQYLSDPEVAHHIETLKEMLQKIDAFTLENLEGTVRGLAREMDLKAADLIHPLRVILTGRAVSPGIFELMHVLGKETVLRRLERWLTQVQTLG